MPDFHAFIGCAILAPERVNYGCPKTMVEKTIAEGSKG